MRKVFLLAAFAFVASVSFAQKLDDVKKDIAANKYADAKTKLDQIFTDPKMATNSDALFYKAQVYQNLGKQNSDTALLSGAVSAMTSYVKAEQGKPEAQRMLLSTLEGNKTIIDMYQASANNGIEKLRAANYAGALSNFEIALSAFDVLKTINLVKAPIDTTITYYAGASAQNLQQHEKAMKYYDQLIANNIVDTNYINMYRYMISVSLEKKDTAAAKKYLSLSQQRFPQYNNDWLNYQTYFLPADKPRRFTEYEALVKANPNNESLASDYATELYTYLRANNDMLKDTVLSTRSENAFKNLLAIDPNSLTGNLLLSQLYWTEYYALEDKIDANKGTFPEAVKKRKELNAQVDVIFDKIYPYLIKTSDLYAQQTTLKPQDKANYRIVLGQLVQYYQRKKQNDKATAAQQKLDSLK